MKKILVRVVVGLLVLIVLAFVLITLFLDSGIKRGVEIVGPRLTKTQVKLNSVSLSLFTGSGKISGLLLGNPEGYRTPSAIQVGTASLALQPRSLFSDKVVIRSITVQAPEITFETDLKGNNLSKILANLQAASGGDTAQSPEAEAKASRKLQVDEFRITGAKLNVSVTALAGKSATVALPDILLTNLGQGPEGITTAELTKKVLQVIEQNAVKAAGPAVADLSKQAGDIAKEAANTAVQKATKSLGDVFKKK
jgi:uncharacterized protein involved in outer membrane biogenesis